MGSFNRGLSDDELFEELMLGNCRSASPFLFPPSWPAQAKSKRMQKRGATLRILDAIPRKVAKKTGHAFTWPVYFLFGELTLNHEAFRVRSIC